MVLLPLNASRLLFACLTFSVVPRRREMAPASVLFSPEDWETLSSFSAGMPILELQFGMGHFHKSLLHVASHAIATRLPRLACLKISVFPMWESDYPEVCPTLHRRTVKHVLVFSFTDSSALFQYMKSLYRDFVAHRKPCSFERAHHAWFLSFNRGSHPPSTGAHFSD